MARIIDDFEVERFYGSMEDCPDRTSDDTWRNPLDDEGAESFEPGFASCSLNPDPSRTSTFLPSPDRA